MNVIIKQQWRYFLTAVMFFTRIPIHLSDFDEVDLNKSTRFFPLVGILVGTLGALVFWLADILLPLEIAVLLSMAATILLTGAFHEDGLADTVDGLGGGWSKMVAAILNKTATSKGNRISANQNTSAPKVPTKIPTNGKNRVDLFRSTSSKSLR